MRMCKCVERIHWLIISVLRNPEEMSEMSIFPNFRIQTFRITFGTNFWLWMNDVSVTEKISYLPNRR